jgi:simple sugar transport system permease protein
MQIKKPRFDRDFASKLIIPFIIFLITAIVTSLLIMSVSVNPLSAYYYMITGALGNIRGIINTVNKAVPIAFAGFAVAISSKAGLFNIGIEGQLVFGAMGCTLAGIYLTGLPQILHIPLSILSGMIFGMLYAALPTLLFIKRKVNLLVVFIMMNNIVRLINTFLVVGPFAGDNKMISATNPVLASAWLPYIIMRPNRLTVGIIIVLFVAVILWCFMDKTTTGYELQAIGFNREAAEYGGIRVNRYLCAALLASGAMAGLAGSVEILGNYHRFYDGFSPGYGFDGIPIAAMAGGNPFGIMIGAFLYGALRVGSLTMQSKTGLSSEIISVIQGLLITLIACQYIFNFSANKLIKKLAGRIRK